MKNSYTKPQYIKLLYVATLFTAFLFSSFLQRQQTAGNSYSRKQFKSLRWLEGTWKGTGDGEAPFYEKYAFVNDTLMQIIYYSDSTLSKSSTDGGVYLSGGRIYHNYKSAVWKIKQMYDRSAEFAPVKRASNSFTWKYTSPNEWTATLFTAGNPKGKVYKLQRIKK